MYIIPRRGFTLIEVMVVVSIIGIFSVAALVATSTARNKGNDAAIKLNLNSVKNQAEIYYSTIGNGKYGAWGGNGSTQTCEAYTSIPTLVFGNSKVLVALDAARKASGASDWSTALCAISVSNDKYAIAIRSKSDSSTWFCLDSTNGIVTLTNQSGSPNLGGYTSPARCP